MPVIATLGYALATLGPALAIGNIGSKTQEATARQPEVRGYLRINMFLAMAFAEALGLFGLVAGLLFQ